MLDWSGKKMFKIKLKKKYFQHNYVLSCYERFQVSTVLTILYCQATKAAVLYMEEVRVTLSPSLHMIVLYTWSQLGLSLVQER